MYCMRLQGLVIWAAFILLGFVENYWVKDKFVLRLTVGTVIVIPRITLPYLKIGRAVLTLYPEFHFVRYSILYALPPHSLSPSESVE